jgi:N-acetylneuraminic acid mutarotase
MRTYREKLCAIVIVVGAVFAAGCETGGTETWVALDTVLEYNPGTDSWAQKAPVLTPRGNCVTASCGGKIYAIGGETVIGGWQYCIARSVEAFDPASDTWERKAPVPITDCVSAFYYSLTVAGKVYVIRNPATVMYEYDPASDSWSPKVSPPVPGRCVALSSDIYVFQETAFHKYDAVAGTWSSCADVPVNYYGIAGASGNIFAVAGYDVAGESPVQMWEYDCRHRR